MTKPMIVFAGIAALMAAMPFSRAVAADPVMPAAPVPAARHFTPQETPIGDLLADPAAKAILDKIIPGLSENPQIGMAASMTLRATQPMAGDKITEEMLKALDAEFAKLPAR